jgi:hypothetical protein
MQQLCKQFVERGHKILFAIVLYSRKPSWLKRIVRISVYGSIETFASLKDINNNQNNNNNNDNNVNLNIVSTHNTQVITH